MKNKVFIFVTTFLMVLNWHSKSFSLQEKTHQAINEHIAQNTVSGFSLNNYLINNLGFKDGFKETLKGIDANGNEVYRKVFEWLGEGGVQEDRPGSNTDYILGKPTRSVNHFHNPLKTNWDEAGLNDTYLGIKFTGKSSILWAQNPNQHIGGRWSWQDARKNYYVALTGRDFDGSAVASTKKERDRYFTDTFRAVGQLMHLVEDASVPEHVRNDIHVPSPIFPHYEQRVEDFRTNKTKYGLFWDNLLASPITFNRSILDIPSSNPSAKVPISRILDTDLYTGDNPNVTKTLYNSPQTIGISEYANTNFLSKGTMFSTDSLHNFYYPQTTDTVLWIDNNKKTYLKKVGSGDVVEHLAISSYLYDFRLRYFPQYKEYLPVALETECYKDYASLLIPRAVGYSAGLLNYFFRGEMDMVPDDATGSGYVIENNTDEDMSGTFELWYDNDKDERKPVQSWTLAISKKSSGNFPYRFLARTMI